MPDKEELELNNKITKDSPDTQENGLTLRAETTSDYYPSRKEMNIFEKVMDSMGKKRKVRPESIKPNHVARTDGFDVDKTVADLDDLVAKDPEDDQKDALRSRLLSVSDLTEKVYDRLGENPNSIKNWLPQLSKAVDSTETFFKIPSTTVLRLPIELAQFIRVEYNETSRKDRALFNSYIFNKLELEMGKTYFIKTGTFSSKFQFANAKCSEPDEMGEYFQVINNFAMTVGAGQSIDVCAREYIEDPENNPTIYNGMPLRTEFRMFVDFDTNKLIGTVPYWHPIVMKMALKMGLSDSMEQDYQTYLSEEDRLLREFNEHHGELNREIQKLIPEIDLKGQYSLDIMKSGDDFYLIDMALMSESALSELLPQYLYTSNQTLLN